MYASKVKCPHHIYTFRREYSSVVNVAMTTTTTLQCSAPVLSSDVNIRRQRNWKRRLDKCQHVPFRCRVMLKIRLSSLHNTAPPVGAHMFLQLLYFTQNKF
jgi:hypothetical protein